MSQLLTRLQTALHPTYTVERELGGGGMSRVFVARETALERRVVIKVLSPELAQSVSAERFRREIQLAASLQHPHIVPLLAAGEVPDLFGPGMPGPYYTMPFVEGESLRARLRRGEAFPVDDVVRILCDLSDALASAHEHGIVHRDIKPENVMLTGHHAMLLDFGVAKALREAADASAAAEGVTQPSLGVALGTPAYMAPEQAAADPAIDHRADIYALGVVAYEMLTGRPPFTAPSVQGVLAAHIGRTPEPVVAHRAGIPAPLAAAVMRALEKHPAERWQTAAEFLEAIESPASGQAAPERARDTKGGRLVLASVGIAVLIAALAATGAVPGISLGGRSLVAEGALAPREQILVAEFENRTRDSLLAGAVAEALRVDLAQSPLIRVIGAEQVQEALRRMQQPAGVRLDPSLAREVAIRDGMKAILAGDVARLGGEYIVSARLVAAESGEELAALQESARDSTEIIRAVGRLSRRLRGRIGESLQSIGDAPGLDRVTTPSLAALRRYSQGSRAYDVEGDQQRALALLDEAIALDTAFAMAYRKKGTILLNDGSGSEALEALEQAYRHRGRLTDLERYLTTGSYRSARGEADQAIGAYRSLLELYPTEGRALNNLGLLYEGVRDFDRAADSYRRAMAADSGITTFINLMRVQATRGDSAGADRTLALMARRFPSHPTVAEQRGDLAAARGDYAGAAKTIAAAMAERPDDSEAITGGSMMLARIAATEGRVNEAERQTRRAIAASERQGDAAEVLDYELFLVHLNADVRRDRERSLRMLGEALARHPITEMPAADRPYLELAYLYSRLGQTGQARALVGQREQAVDTVLQWRDQAAASGVSAMIALAERRPADAIGHLESVEQDQKYCDICPLPHLARAYDLAGRRDSAVALYERYVESRSLVRSKTDPFYLAAAHEQLGQLYEERGEREKAAAHLGRFIDLWTNADADLQPRVADARRRLATLVGETPVKAAGFVIP